MRHTLYYIDSPYQRLSLLLLKKYYQKFKHLQDTSVVKFLLNIAHSYSYFHEDDSSKMYLDTAWQRLQVFDKPTAALAGYYLQTSYYFRFIDNVDSTQWYARQGYRIATQVGYTNGALDAIHNLGLVHHNLTSNYDSATWYYLKGYKLAEEHQDTLWLIKLSVLLGYIGGNISDKNMELQYTHKSLYLSEISPYKGELVPILDQLMLIHFYGQNPDSVIYYANRILALGKDIGHYYPKRAAMFKAEMFYNDGQYQQATQYYLMADSIARMSEHKLLSSQKQLSNSARYYLYYINQGLFNVSQALNNHDDMRYYLQQVAAYVDSSHYTTLQGLNQDYARLAVATNNIADADAYYTQALYYQEKTHKWQDSVRGAKAMEHAAELEKQYQTEKKQRQIFELESQNQLQATENTMLLAGIGVALLALGAGVYLYRKIQGKNKQLDHASTLLQESNTTKDKLISMVSHDLRRPMDNLKILLQLMENRDTLSLIQEKPEFIADVQEEFSRVNTMLRDLLFWVVLQRDALVYHPQQFELQQLIDEQVNLLKPVIRSKELRLVNNMSNYVVHTDRDMLRFILRNLLSNAAQYTPERGTITLSTALNQQENTLNITVQDTGLGMDQATVDGLFQVNFNRAALDLSKSGAGMGLSLCADIAKKMGATLYASSQQGKGSAFVIALPAQVVEQIAQPTTQPQTTKQATTIAT